MVTLMASSSSDELLRAEAELWCHAFGYLKSTALQCAIKLGIPNAIHRCGGAASLSELHAALPVAAGKQACLSRLMRFLAASGIFREEADTGSRYGLTPVSRLLVIPNAGGDGNDRNGGGRTCLSQLILFTNSPFHLKSSQCLAEWLQKEEEEDGAGAEAAETPLAMALAGSGFYSVAGTDVEFGRFFNGAMASDSRFVAEIIVRECREVFTGVTSLVDVGGGEGTMAVAIAKAFPQMRCLVLELPQVVDAAPPADGGGAVEFLAGDMMEFIPSADVLLLKWILHNWSDEDCVRILKRCKEAVSTRDPKGKVVIIDVVVGSQSKQMLEAQLVSDLCMMLLTTGEERDMEKWQTIFKDAGFTRYKISPVLGFRSLIELYP